MHEIENCPKHIAIIMDGNRRWANKNGLTTKEGHKKGADNLQTIARYCNKLGVKYLTVYAFSTENWKRSEEEFKGLMFLLKNYLNDFSKKADTENIKINIIGDITKLSSDLQDQMIECMERTRNNTGLNLNIAFNYGGRAEIVNAIKNIVKDKIKPEDITEELVTNYMYTANQPDPDLLIRTGGELRTSNFLPWQLIYTEFYFPNTYWPEFDENELLKAIQTYKSRNRKFGGK